MFDEDPKPTPSFDGLPRPLDPLSVEDLQDYLVLLDAEKQRVQSEISRRGAAKAGADAVFKI